ncbi:MAG: radical SAM protein [Nitrospirae bacterium]|nr:radical SAM protein [Nitrospirota bacterium]
MKICEFFSSIQGESSYAGLPCFFIRLTGCNLRCSYCDTTYAYDEGTDYSIAEIIEKTVQSGIRLVEITGGEPLMQDNSRLLIDKLIALDYEVLIETNGSISIKELNKKAVIIMDIKTPSSGVTEKMDMQNIDYLKPTDEVKFVISDKRDFDWTRDMIRDYKLEGRSKILLSPILEPEILVRWMLEIGAIGTPIKARLNLQIHKYIFKDGLRGR